MNNREVFQVGNSFVFAIQIPDDSVGISGSRCSNCDTAVAYCEHLCKKCKMPFVGPYGFPQIGEWNTLSTEQKRSKVEEIYDRENHGRIRYVGIPGVPLTPHEVRKIIHLGISERERFRSAHGMGLDEFLQPR